MEEVLNKLLSREGFKIYQKATKMQQVSTEKSDENELGLWLKLIKN